MVHSYRSGKGTQSIDTWDHRDSVSSARDPAKRCARPEAAAITAGMVHSFIVAHGLTQPARLARASAGRLCMHTSMCRREACMTRVGNILQDDAAFSCIHLPLIPATYPQLAML